MKYMILIHTALAGSGGGRGNSLDFVLFDLSAGGLGAPGLRVGVKARVPSSVPWLSWRRLSARVEGCRRDSSARIVLAARQVTCRVGSRDGAASPCWRRHPHGDLALSPGLVAGMTTFTTLARTSTGLRAW
jgi:hypothetical protein